MATSMEQVDLTRNGQFLEFSGSSEADIANAKTFWKSILLMPPAESRLVSGDIRQRLKTAEPGSQAVHIEHQPMEYPQQLVECLAKARAEEEKERQERNEEVNKRRKDQKELLNQQRQIRIQKEAMSGIHRGLPSWQDEKEIEVKESWQDEVDPEQCLRDIDEFDQKLRNGRPQTPESRQ